MIDVNTKSGVRLKKKEKERESEGEKDEAQKSGLIFRGRLNFLAYFLLIQNWLFFRRPFYFRQEFLKRVPEKNVRRPRVVGRWSELDLAHPAEGLSSSLFLPFPLHLSSAPSPLSLSLSVPSVSPFLVPSHATERDRKKNREPGERTASSAPENTGRQFCATVPGGWASESGSHTLVFFLLVGVHFALVLIFIHGGKNCAAPSNFREIIAAR